MEKSNSRARRNESSPHKGLAKMPGADYEIEAATSVAVASAAGADARGTPGTEAQPRMKTATGAAVIDRPALSRGLHDAFIDERNDVLAVINELEDQLDRQQEIRETVERELTSTSEQLQSANQRVQELEWQVVTLQTRVDALEQLRHEVAALEEELNDANLRAQRTNEQLAAADQERNRLRGELKTANKQVDELWSVRKERDGLRSDYKILSAKAEELERTQREILEDRAALQSQLQETQAALEEMTGERNQLLNSLRGVEDRVRELGQARDALEEKIELLRAEKKNLQVQITHLERENARLVDQRQFYECEVTSLRNQSRTAESALASVKKAFAEVRVALNETKSRARRRTLDSWPRVGSPLRGIGDTELSHDASVTAEGAADMACVSDAPTDPIGEPVASVEDVATHEGEPGPGV